MSRDILQAPLKPFGHGNEGVTVSLAALTVIAIHGYSHSDGVEDGANRVRERRGFHFREGEPNGEGLLPRADKDEIMRVEGNNYLMGEYDIGMPV